MTLTFVALRSAGFCAPLTLGWVGRCRQPPIVARRGVFRRRHPSGGHATVGHQAQKRSESGGQAAANLDRTVESAAVGSPSPIAGAPTRAHHRGCDCRWEGARPPPCEKRAYP